MILLTTKLVEKILDSSCDKEYYKLFLKKKNKKLVQQPKIITQQPKTTENWNIIISYYKTFKSCKDYKVGWIGFPSKWFWQGFY